MTTQTQKLHNRARGAVAAALDRGRLSRPDVCSACGSDGRLQAHHYLGYEREHYLDIEWLCLDCHKGRHATDLRIISSSPVKRRVIWMTDEQWEWLREEAERRGLTISGLIRQAIRETMR